jgi:uncharacterized protein (TIGR03435 family)
MIMTAYRTYAGGRLNPPWTWPTPPSTESLQPDWIMRDRFTIEATTDAHPSPEVMRGPMLQAVLEDRFKVKMHVDTREMPVVELIVAKNGSKLTLFKPGSCVPQEPWNADGPELQAGQRWCGSPPKPDDSSGQRVVTITVEGKSLDNFAQTIRLHHLPVVNRTGLSGLFTFRYVDPLGPEGPVDALKALGLDTRPGKAMLEFLMLEHFERPTPNDLDKVPATQLNARGTSHATVPSRSSGLHIHCCCRQRQCAGHACPASGGRPGADVERRAGGA